MALLHVSLPPARSVGDILYSQIPQVLDPITNPPCGGPCDLPAYTPLQTFHRYVFIRLRKFPSSSSLLRVFIVNKHCILSNAFSPSLKMIMWILFLIVLIWYITLTDIQMFNQPCILRVSVLFQARTPSPRGQQGGILPGTSPC